jgi:hypothetical protein
MVSELTWKNGPSPRSGSALTMPPPVPSSPSRSLEMATFGREALQHVVDQRLAADRHHRLRHAGRQRRHAGAEPGRQHHGAAWFEDRSGGRRHVRS